MSRQFEKEYIETNDRIHPRQDLLQELEKKWAAEEAREAEEAKKVVAFPVWARFAAAAAGIVLCVGVGMGSVLLYSRGRGQMNKTASAERAELTAAGAADMAAAEPEEKILFETVETEDAVDADAEAPMTMLAAAPTEAPRGTHFARDEAEVEDAVRYAGVDMGAKKAADTANETQTAAVAAGKLIRRDDRIAVFQPTLDEIHVIEYTNKQVNDVFALTLREKGREVRDIFWLGSEFVAIRTQAAETELLRFDVSDWKAPRHLKNLTQSGTLLGAWEMGERLFILSLYTATAEEPLPWVNGQRLDFDRVLLDSDRPGDTFALLTVYEPGLGDGFGGAIALLAPVEGAVEGGLDKLLLWTEEAELYEIALGVHGLVLMAEGQGTGSILDAGEAGEGFSLLLENGAEMTLATVDADLAEVSKTTASIGEVRWARVYEDGAVILTASDMHFLAESGDHVLDVTGDAFCWLTPDRGLILSADGQLQVVSVLGTGLEALGAAQARGGLGSLVDEPDRLAFDMATGRLVIPAGQHVYPYVVDEAGQLTQRGEVQAFSDHDENDQRELRVLLFDDRALLFYKAGVMLCNQNMNRLQTCKY